MARGGSKLHQSYNRNHLPVISERGSYDVSTPGNRHDLQHSQGNNVRTVTDLIATPHGPGHAFLHGHTELRISRALPETESFSQHSRNGVHSNYAYLVSNRDVEISEQQIRRQTTQSGCYSISSSRAMAFHAAGCLPKGISLYDEKNPFPSCLYPNPVQIELNVKPAEKPPELMEASDFVSSPSRHVRVSLFSSSDTPNQISLKLLHDDLPETEPEPENIEMPVELMPSPPPPDEVVQVNVLPVGDSTMAHMKEHCRSGLAVSGVGMRILGKAAVSSLKGLRRGCKVFLHKSAPIAKEGTVACIRKTEDYVQGMKIACIACLNSFGDDSEDEMDEIEEFPQLGSNRPSYYDADVAWKGSLRLYPSEPTEEPEVQLPDSEVNNSPGDPTADFMGENPQGIPTPELSIFEGYPYYVQERDCTTGSAARNFDNAKSIVPFKEAIHQDNVSGDYRVDPCTRLKRRLSLLPVKSKSRGNQGLGVLAWQPPDIRTLGEQLLTARLAVRPEPRHYRDLIQKPPLEDEAVWRSTLRAYLREKRTVRPEDVLICGRATPRKILSREDFETHEEDNGVSSDKRARQGYTRICSEKRSANSISGSNSKRRFHGHTFKKHAQVLKNSHGDAVVHHSVTKEKPAPQKFLPHRPGKVRKQFGNSSFPHLKHDECARIAKSHGNEKLKRKEDSSHAISTIDSRMDDGDFWQRNPIHSSESDWEALPASQALHHRKKRPHSPQPSMEEVSHSSDKCDNSSPAHHAGKHQKLEVLSAPDSLMKAKFSKRPLKFRKHKLSSDRAKVGYPAESEHSGSSLTSWQPSQTPQPTLFKHVGDEISPPFTRQPNAKPCFSLAKSSQTLSKSSVDEDAHSADSPNQHLHSLRVSRSPKLGLNNDKGHPSSVRGHPPKELKRKGRFCNNTVRRSSSRGSHNPDLDHSKRQSRISVLTGGLSFLWPFSRSARKPRVRAAESEENTDLLKSSKLSFWFLPSKGKSRFSMFKKRRRVSRPHSGPGTPQRMNRKLVRDNSNVSLVSGHGKKRGRGLSPSQSQDSRNAAKKRHLVHENIPRVKIFLSKKDPSKLRVLSRPDPLLHNGTAPVESADNKERTLKKSSSSTTGNKTTFKTKKKTNPEARNRKKDGTEVSELRSVFSFPFPIKAAGPRKQDCGNLSGLSDCADRNRTSPTQTPSSPRKTSKGPLYTNGGAVVQSGRGRLRHSDHLQASSPSLSKFKKKMHRYADPKPDSLTTSKFFTPQKTQVRKSFHQNRDSEKIQSSDSRKKQEDQMSKMDSEPVSKPQIDDVRAISSGYEEKLVPVPVTRVSFTVHDDQIGLPQADDITKGNTPKSGVLQLSDKVLDGGDEDASSSNTRFQRNPEIIKLLVAYKEALIKEVKSPYNGTLDSESVEELGTILKLESHATQPDSYQNSTPLILDRSKEDVGSSKLNNEHLNNSNIVAQFDKFPKREVYGAQYPSNVIPSGDEDEDTSSSYDTLFHQDDEIPGQLLIPYKELLIKEVNLSPYNGTLDSEGTLNSESVHELVTILELESDDTKSDSYQHSALSILDRSKEGVLGSESEQINQHLKGEDDHKRESESNSESQSQNRTLENISESYYSETAAQSDQFPKKEVHSPPDDHNLVGTSGPSVEDAGQYQQKHVYDQQDSGQIINENESANSSASHEPNLTLSLAAESPQPMSEIPPVSPHVAKPRLFEIEIDTVEESVIVDDYDEALSDEEQDDDDETSGEEKVEFHRSIAEDRVILEEMVNRFIEGNKQEIPSDSEEDQSPVHVTSKMPQESQLGRGKGQRKGLVSEDNNQSSSMSHLSEDTNQAEANQKSMGFEHSELSAHLNLKDESGDKLDESHLETQFSSSSASQSHQVDSEAVPPSHELSELRPSPKQPHDRDHREGDPQGNTLPDASFLFNEKNSEPPISELEQFQNLAAERRHVVHMEETVQDDQLSLTSSPPEGSGINQHRSESEQDVSGSSHTMNHGGSKQAGVENDEEQVHDDDMHDHKLESVNTEDGEDDNQSLPSSNQASTRSAMIDQNFPELQFFEKLAAWEMVARSYETLAKQPGGPSDDINIDGKVYFEHDQLSPPASLQVIGLDLATPMKQQAPKKRGLADYHDEIAHLKTGKETHELGRQYTFDEMAHLGHELEKDFSEEDLSRSSAQGDSVRGDDLDHTEVRGLTTAEKHISDNQRLYVEIEDSVTLEELEVFNELESKSPLSDAHEGKSHHGEDGGYLMGDNTQLGSPSSQSAGSSEVDPEILQVSDKRIAFTSISTVEKELEDTNAFEGVSSAEEELFYNTESRTPVTLDEDYDLRDIKTNFNGGVSGDPFLSKISASSTVQSLNSETYDTASEQGFGTSSTSDTEGGIRRTRSFDGLSSPESGSPSPSPRRKLNISDRGPNNIVPPALPLLEITLDSTTSSTEIRTRTIIDEEVIVLDSDDKEGFDRLIQPMTSSSLKKSLVADSETEQILAQLQSEENEAAPQQPPPAGIAQRLNIIRQDETGIRRSSSFGGLPGSGSDGGLVRARPRKSLFTRPLLKKSLVADAETEQTFSRLRSEQLDAVDDPLSGNMEASSSELTESRSSKLPFDLQSSDGILTSPARSRKSLLTRPMLKKSLVADSETEKLFARVKSEQNEVEEDTRSEGGEPAGNPLPARPRKSFFTRPILKKSLVVDSETEKLFDRLSSKQNEDDINRSAQNFDGIGERVVGRSASFEGLLGTSGSSSPTISEGSDGRPMPARPRKSLITRPILKKSLVVESETEKLFDRLQSQQNEVEDTRSEQGGISRSASFENLPSSSRSSSLGTNSEGSDGSLISTRPRKSLLTRPVLKKSLVADSETTSAFAQLQSEKNEVEETFSPPGPLSTQVSADRESPPGSQKSVVVRPALKRSLTITSETDEGLAQYQSENQLQPPRKRVKFDASPEDTSTDSEDRVY